MQQIKSFQDEESKQEKQEVEQISGNNIKEDKLHVIQSEERWIKKP